MTTRVTQERRSAGAPAPPHPGIRTVIDGSGAVVWVEKHVSQGACAYPITPTTNMGAEYAAAVGDGWRNLWGDALAFLEPESEHSSASAAEGFAAAGGRVTNFTSGQGLVLMKIGHDQLVIAYTTCQPEHGVGDERSAAQAKLAVDSRAFPLLSYDPRRGGSLRERLDLQGNPSPGKDWHAGKSGEPIDFVRFARSEGRFAKHFGPDGAPSAALLAAQAQVLESWRTLRELAGR